MNKENFYKIIREELFKGYLTQTQVNGINAILDITTDLNLPSRAYILATVYHETARRMYPLSEFGKGATYVYGKWRTNSKGQQYCFKNGTRTTTYLKATCPHLFYGRGLVQLTWFDNYEKATIKLKQLGILKPSQDLVQQPELANDPIIATWIMKVGMVEGWFTGRKLENYFVGSKKDYLNARRIINGMDQAVLIKKYAEIFEKALTA